MQTEDFPARIERELSAAGEAGDRLRPHLARIESKATNLTFHPVGFTATFERPGCKPVELVVTDGHKTWWAVVLSVSGKTYYPPHHLAAALESAGWPAATRPHDAGHADSEGGEA